MSSLTFEPLETTTSPYINRFVQPDTIIPDLSNPQSWNRFSYVTNRAVNFSDPSGHREVSGCSELAGGCHVTQNIIDKDLGKANRFRTTTEQNKCKAGEKQYCSYAQNHPGEVMIFGVTGLVGGAALETFILGGGAAGALVSAEAGYQAVYSNAALTCLKSAVCRGFFGIGGLPATRVFWSGGDTAKQEAQKWAAANNGITLNQTFGGRIAEVASKILPNQIMRPVWDALSRNFAQGASDDVAVVINQASYSPTSTFARTELPALANNPYVKNIIGFFTGSGN